MPQSQEIPPPPVILPEALPLRGLPAEFDLFQIFQPQIVPQADLMLAPVEQTKPIPAPTDAQSQTLLWMNIDTMLDKVPPGASIGSWQFAANFGAEAAAQLSKAGLTSIINTAKPGHQSHFLLGFNKPGAVLTKNGELDVATAVSFDYFKSPTGEVDLHNVHGLTGKANHGIKSWGTATVDDVSIVHESNGNVKLTGKAHFLGFFHGQATYEFGPDGTQVVQPDGPKVVQPPVAPASIPTA